jgi:cytochrome c553
MILMAGVPFPRRRNRFASDSNLGYSEFCPDDFPPDSTIMSRAFLLAAILECILGVPPIKGQGFPGQDFFEAKVRPVLAEHCFRCHGAEKQKGGLRLDSRSAVLKGGESGPALVPGDPEKSLLLQAVNQQGDLKMPPKGKLTAHDITHLAAWIKAGAPWPESRDKTHARFDSAWKRHWAFQPFRAAPYPSVKDRCWPANAIDRYILAQLEKKGLSPSPPADRLTLIRRVSFDLIGLPPTPIEIDDFLADKSPDAFAKVVDRLLSSPHYGERWGRYWLDVARYADTKGYVFFQAADFTWAYTYRDYVIRSFNEDLRYDRFVLEQLAADQILDLSSADRRSLTALGFLTLGGRFMNNLHDIMDDRIDVVTRGLLGLTVTCARCHDHKYDPIPAKDYYALYGVFASCVEPEVPPLFVPPPRTELYAKFEKELQTREKKLSDFVSARHRELVRMARKRAAEYLLAAHALRNQPSIDEFMLISDPNDLNPTMIQRWKYFLERMRKKDDPVFAIWNAFAEIPEKEFAAKADDLCRRVSIKSNPLVAQEFLDKPPKSMKDLAHRYAELLNGVEREWEKSGRLASFSDPHRQALHRVFHGPDAPPDVGPAELNDLALLPDRASQAKFQELRKAVETWRATGAGAPPRAMVLVDMPRPYSPRVFKRGNPNNPGESVPRRFLSALAGLQPRPFQKGSGRLELAQAIVRPDNPLTARVLVNRIWLHHFGVGLVRTPSDFGLRSEPPSHPELLDYLASTFVADGWSIKKLHRRILLSRTYQQQSDGRAPGLAVDPDNRLLWKMNRRRLDFETTRDAMLAVSGRLDTSIGGPSVKNIVSSARRTLYGYVDRLNIPSLYRTFDFPSPDATSPQRDETTVPQQALFFMNNPLTLECARKLLARSEWSTITDVSGRIESMYRLLYGRRPTADEIELAGVYVRDGSSTAWQRYVQALMLANEFVFID